MKFGAVPLKEALGATAVHSIRQDGLVLKKGTPIGPAEVAALEAAGIKEVVVARLEPDDIAEDVAAAEIAKAVAGEGVDRDRQNHSICGKPAGSRCGARRSGKTVAAGRPLPHPQSRRSVYALAWPRGQGHREDTQDHCGAASASRRRHHCRAARAA